MEDPTLLEAIASNVKTTADYKNFVRLFPMGTSKKLLFVSRVAGPGFESYYEYVQFFDTKIYEIATSEGKIAMEGPLRDNKETGRWKEYFNGQYYGEVIYDGKGQREKVTLFRKDGDEIFYYEDGRVIFEVQFYPNGGGIENERRFQENNRVLFKSFWPDGRLKERGYCVAGFRHGDWEVWDIDGNKRIVEYFYGKLKI